MSNLLNGFDTSSKIRALMAAKRLTQANLATILDVTRETINNRFADNRWSVKELEIIAHEYGVDKQDLI